MIEWLNAKHIADGMVSEWMRATAPERTMDNLRNIIQVELIKALNTGRLSALEQAADIADGEDCQHCAAAIRALKEES